MRPLLISLLLVTAPQGLSEFDKAQAELHQNKVALLSCQEQLVGAQVQLQKASLTDEQTRLEKRFRDILHPADGDVFSWTTLAFEKPK